MGRKHKKSDSPLDVRTGRVDLCTDLANARRFKRFAEGLAVFTHEFGWFVWDGRRWVIDKDDWVRKMAHDLADIIKHEAVSCADRDLAESLWKWAKRSGSTPAISNCLREAQTLMSAQASEFDQHPLRVNFLNGTLDFDRIDGEIPKSYAHYRGDYLTTLIPHDWYFTAPRNRWRSFVETILPDPEIRAFVQRALGYSLLGTTREQCIFIAHGLGANGKSVLLNTVSTLLGPDYARQVDPQTFALRNDRGVRNDLARLLNARFVVASESADGVRLDEALIKSVTGGEAIAARFLYREHFEYRPQFKLWLVTNHLPVISGTDHAIWRRIHVIPFTTTIPDSEQDRDLPAKLLQEAEGILDWLVEGAVEYLRHGLQPPHAVLSATDEYRNSLDSVRRFLAERTRPQRGSSCGKTEMFKAYLAWCRKSDVEPLTQRAFSKRMTDAQFVSHLGTAGKHVWLSVALLADGNDGSDANDALSDK